METSKIISIGLGVLTVVVAIVSYWLYIMGKIKNAAVDAVNSAESFDAVGEEKMNIAVQQIYQIIPAILKPIITTEFLRQIIQPIFEKMKQYAEKKYGNTDK